MCMGLLRPGCAPEIVCACAYRHVLPCPPAYHVIVTQGLPEARKTWRPLSLVIAQHLLFYYFIICLFKITSVLPFRRMIMLYKIKSNAINHTAAIGVAKRYEKVR